MAVLNPAPATLALASPALGPWFSVAATSIPLPSADLGASMALTPGMQWLAPAGCTAAYFVATSPPPAGLSHLKQANGTPAFPDDTPTFGNNALIVLVTLLPEVELRLAALSNVVVLPSNVNATAPGGQPGRPPVRYLAMEFPVSNAVTIDAVGQLRATPFPIDLVSDAEKAEYLGLAIEGGALGNARAPVAELHRPVLSSAVLVQNTTANAISVKLWAFDDRGHALDPGAVASWWGHMASGTAAAGDPLFSNLWADTANPRTATAVAGFSVQFCTGSESPLQATLLNRLTLNAAFARMGVSSVFQVTTTAAPTIVLSNPIPNQTDYLPSAEVALLPNGTYAALGQANTLTLFNGWAAAGWPNTLARDFARVAVVDVESHLVGLDRDNANQANVRLRINAARNTVAAPFFATAEPAANQIFTTLAATAATPAVAMAPVMDTDWSALTPAAFGAGSILALDFEIHALAGGGVSNGETAQAQTVVVHFDTFSLPAGAWVRLWPHGLDTATGLRFRQDGGGGLASVQGEAYVAMRVPDGTTGEALSFDALVVTSTNAIYYTEQRFVRPAPVGGARLALPAPNDYTVWMCEQGAAFVAGARALGGGVTLVGVPDTFSENPYALIDMTTVAAADFAASVLRNAAGATDRLVVTEPAFAAGTEGDIIGPTGPNNVPVLRRQRYGALAPLVGMGQPVPTMERREVLAIDPTAGAQTGVVAAISGRATDHEAIPAQFAHPGMPAAAEIHGTGVALAGPITAVLNMLARERMVASFADPIAPIDFVRVAGLANISAGGAAPSTFAAILETVARGVPGDLLTRTLAALNVNAGNPWSQIETNINAVLNELPGSPSYDTLTGGLGYDDDTAAFAIDQLIAKSNSGAALGASAIQAAIDRADDFIYVETPALDALTATGGIDLIGALAGRLGIRPGLKVILCVPEKFLPGQPERLEMLRVAGINAALQRLLDAGPGRVVLFTPTAGSGRPLHMASTTVVVDDVFLLTGTTHLWRRGLTFDSSLAVAMFDEATTLGRPAVVRAARRQLLADRLAIVPNQVPDDPAHMVDALQRLNTIGGLQRVRPGVYAPAADSTSPVDLTLWNPDGMDPGVTDWFEFFGALINTTAGTNNAIR